MKGALRWSRTIDAVGALVLLPMSALVASRLLRLDEHSGWVYAMQTLVPIALLPAYALGLTACLARRWLIGAVAVAVAFTHLAWTLPLGASDGPGGSASGSPFTLVAANVAANNTRLDDVAAALAGTKASVIVVTELTPAIQVELARPLFADQYPHRIEDARSGFFGSGIYSAFPIEEPQRIQLAGLPTVRGTLTIGDTRATLIAIHTMQPLTDLGTLRQQHAELRVLADTTHGPLILAGDFNATVQHRPFRDLLKSRLRDSHVERGRILARTWPANLAVPPFALVDHVLVSEEVAVGQVAEFRIQGSDHRGVSVELELPPRLAPGNSVGRR